MAIKTTAKIKKMTVKADGADLQFCEMSLPSAKIKQLSDLIETDEVIQLTIESRQKQLPFGDENDEGENGEE